MTISDNHLVIPMAYYASGIAIADYLTGHAPEAIYSLKKFPETSGLMIVKRAKRLWKVGTTFKPVSVTNEPTRAETNRARTTALNQACVILAGTAGMQHVEKIHKEVVTPLFHLIVDDLGRAATALEPVTTTAEVAGLMAFPILESLMHLYQSKEIKQLIKEMTSEVLKSGELSDAHGGRLGNILIKFREMQVGPSHTLVKWPSIKSHYINLHNMDSTGANSNGSL